MSARAEPCAGRDLREATNPEVLTVRVALPPPLSGINTAEGANMHVGDDADAGATEQLKETVSANPFRPINDTPATPALPAVIAPRVLGDAVKLKSACGGGGPFFKAK